MSVECLVFSITYGITKKDSTFNTHETQHSTLKTQH